MADNGMLTDAQIMEDPSGKFEHEKEVKRIEEARAVDGLFSMNVSDSLFEHLFPYTSKRRTLLTEVCYNLTRVNAGDGGDTLSSTPLCE